MKIIQVVTRLTWNNVELRRRFLRRAWTGVAGLCFAVGAVAVATTTAEAQRSGRGRLADFIEPPAAELGVRAGHDFQIDAFSLGGGARIPLFRRLELAPSGDVFFGDSRTDWQLNADIAFRLRRLGGIYGGGGLGVLSRDIEGNGTAETHAGMNVFAGLRLPGVRLPVRPFVEARWTFVKGESPFRLLAGAGIPLGDWTLRRPRRR